MQGFPPPPGKRVTKHNAYLPKFAVWGHQHMFELYPTHRISKGEARSVAFPRTPMDGKINAMIVGAPKMPERGKWVVRIRDFNLGARQMRFVDLLREMGTDAILIMHRGRIVSEQYFRGMEPRSPHFLWSASKPIATGVAVNLIDRRPQRTHPHGRDRFFTRPKITHEDARTGKQELKRKVTAMANSLAFTPDGKLLATGSWKGVTFLDAKTFESRGELEPPTQSRNEVRLAFSRKGDFVAVATNDKKEGSLTLWKLDKHEAANP